MAAKESGLNYERVFVPYKGHAGWRPAQQRFVLDRELFMHEFRPKGLWRTTHVTRIPVTDENNPDGGCTWIDARLFGDGYLRGNVRAESGEIQTIAVDVRDRLTES